MFLPLQGTSRTSCSSISYMCVRSYPYQTSLNLRIDLFEFFSYHHLIDGAEYYLVTESDFLVIEEKYAWKESYFENLALMLLHCIPLECSLYRHSVFIWRPSSSRLMVIWRVFELSLQLNAVIDHTPRSFYQRRASACCAACSLDSTYCLIILLVTRSSPAS